MTLTKNMNWVKLAAVMGFLLASPLGNGFVGPQTSFGQDDSAATDRQRRVVATQMKMLQNALDIYRLDMGDYPAAEHGLKILIGLPADIEARRWRGPYLVELPRDPWGKPYAYELYEDENGISRADILSWGPDGTENTDDDITASGRNRMQTWRSIGITLPDDYPTDLIPMVAALNASRGRWRFQSVVSQGGLEAEVTGEAIIVGGFEEAMLHENFPQWQMRLRFEWQEMKHEMIVVMMLLPGPDEMTMWTVRPQLDGRGQRLDGTWNAATRSIDWKPVRPNADETVTMTTRFGMAGKIIVQESLMIGDDQVFTQLGQLVERIEDPDFDPTDVRATKPLPNGYSFFRASSKEIYIQDSDGGLELGPAVSKFATEDELVVGIISSLPRRGPEDLDTLGYFIFDTGDGSAVKGMSKEEWLEELKKRGLSEEPELIDTGGNWPWGNWENKDG